MESGVVGVKVHMPLELAVVVPTTVPSMITVTVLPGWAVPVMGGVVLVWMEPLVGLTITGTVGVVPATPKMIGAEVSLVPPEVVSVAVAV
jgi:hypothetical protein